MIQGADASPASDLYAAGVVLRRCAGESPPARLARLVERLTQTEPGQRPRSARAALDELGASPRARPSGAVEAPTSWVDAAERTRTIAAQAREPTFSRREHGLLPPVDAATTRALLVLVGLLVILAVLASAGGREPSRPEGAAATAAAREAPLEQQLDALDRAVRAAAR